MASNRFVNPDHYRILGVEKAASLTDIKRAYRRLARKLHPDVNRDPDALRKMQEVIEAYRVLSDAAKRSKYDAEKEAGFPNSPPPPTAAGEVRVSHLLSIVDLPSPVYCLAFTGREELAAVCFDNALHFLQPFTGQTLGKLDLNGGGVSSIKSVGKRKIIAAGTGDRLFSTWAISNHRLEHSKTKRVEWASQVAISPKGDVAIGCVDRTLQVFNASSGKSRFVMTSPDGPVTTLSYSNNGGLLAVGGSDKVTVYEAAHGIEMASFDGFGFAPVHSAFSPDDSLLAIALADHSIRIVEMRTGKTRKPLWGHETPIEAIAFHPSNWMLASGCRKGETRLWNALGATQIAHLGGHTGPIKALAFSEDGRLFAVGGLDRVVSIWSIEIAEHVAEA
ncbi:MAG TPA: DnaJ domain-containing protein [Fimbriimonadales bacterium]|nr:DnaJ domain-containing protein [Fimbriimonadales bacterium]